MVLVWWMQRPWCWRLRSGGLFLLSTPAVRFLRDATGKWNCRQVKYAADRTRCAEMKPGWAQEQRKTNAVASGFRLSLRTVKLLPPLLYLSSVSSCTHGGTDHFLIFKRQSVNAVKKHTQAYAIITSRESEAVPSFLAGSQTDSPGLFMDRICRWAKCVVSWPQDCISAFSDDVVLPASSGPDFWLGGLKPSGGDEVLDEDLELAKCSKCEMSLYWKTVEYSNQHCFLQSVYSAQLN